MVSGGSAAIPASNAGSIAGGAAGYAISRIAKATSRIIARGENSSYNINTSRRTNGSVQGNSGGERRGITGYGSGKYWNSSLYPYRAKIPGKSAKEQDKLSEY